MSTTLPHRFTGHIPGTQLVVDQFTTSLLPDTTSHPRLLFFLSHHHADHMQGLNAQFSRGKIYCTEVTARLVLHHYPTLKSLVHVLPYDQPTILLTPPLGSVVHTPANNIHTRYDTSGMTSITVTAVDANHCPGSAMFIFQGSFGKVLYTGDYRYDHQLYHNVPRAEADVKDSAWGLVLNDNALDAHPLHRYGKHCDLMISDVTFGHPRCEFPLKQVAAGAVVKLVSEFVQQHTTPNNPVYDETSQRWNVRVYLAADMLGAEPVLQALCSAVTHAEQCYCHPADPRYAELQLLSDFRSLVQCTDPHQSLVQLCEGQMFTHFAMEEQQRRSALMAANDGALPASEPRAVLFVKPSTMWFVQHGINQPALSGIDSKPPTPAPSASITSLDKYGVHHVLYSMHSDLYEILELVRAIQPRQFMPMNSPVLLEASDTPHSSITHLQDDNVKAGSSMLQRSSNGTGSSMSRSTSTHLNASSHPNHLASAAQRVFSELDVCQHIQQQLRHWLPAESQLIQVVSPSQLAQCLPQAALPAQFQQLSPIRMTNYHPSVYAAVAIRNRQRLHRQATASTKQDSSDVDTKAGVKRSHSSPVKQAPSAIGGKRLISIMGLAPIVKHAPMPPSSDTSAWLLPQRRSQLLSHVLDFHTLNTMSAWLAHDLSITDRQTSIAYLKQLGATVRYEFPFGSNAQSTQSNQRLLIIVDGHRSNSHAMLHKLTDKIRQWQSTSSSSNSSAVYIYTKYALYAWMAYRQPSLDDSAASEYPPDLTPHYLWRTGMDIIDKPSTDGCQTQASPASSQPQSVSALLTPTLSDVSNLMSQPPPLEDSDSPAKKLPRIERAATGVVTKLEFAATCPMDVIVID